MKADELLHGISTFITKPDLRFRFLLEHGIYDWMSDEKYLAKVFRRRLGYNLNLENPKTFNEKLQWLKLYDRKSMYTTMVDKYAVKQYVSDIIGEEYIIPTLGVWNRPEEIDWDLLPNQFVLKVTHDSGGVVICHNKSKLDKVTAIKKIKKSLKYDYYKLQREWPYKNVPRRIIAETYLEDNDSDELKDYKFYCFNGEPKYCQVISERFSGEKIDFFDMEWNHQDFTGLALPHKPFSKSPIPIPIRFEEMKQSASKLSKDIPFLRVDFYEVNGKMYFGELTLYPASGFGVFEPDEWNKILGDLIILPKKVCKIVE